MWIGGIGVPADVPYVEYDENEAVCPQCGSAFRSPEVLEAHLQESHSGPKPPTVPEPARSVRCSVCGEKFASVAALQRHNRQAHMA